MTFRYSFEFFPPATEDGRSNLLAVAKDLAAHEPRFVSVTYGAGGTTRDRTIHAVQALAQSLSVPVAGHLTTVGDGEGETHEILDAYAEAGVRHLVALRGDAAPTPADAANSSQSPSSGYRTAAELVAGIRSRADATRWDISVAAYPEVHPLAPSASADLDNLKAKLDAGADRAITQFFFDPEVFLRFRDAAVRAGIKAPIVPGIMPINSFSGVARFADRCGARIPAWLSALFEGLDDDPEVHRCVAATVAAEQCARLATEGVEDFHFYTMNRRQLTTAAIRHLDRGPATAHGRPPQSDGSPQS